MNLLIVDDEIETINGIMTGIHWDNLPVYNVYKASCVEEARASLAAHKVNVILCDIEMPDGTGLDLIAWIGKNYPDIICLVLTCHAEFSYAQRAVSLACRDYLLKPIEYGELEGKLRDICEELGEKFENEKYLKYGRDWVKTIKAKDGAASYTSKKEMIEQTQSYIRMHLQEELKLEALAARAAISSDYLSRLFKKETGVGINDFILEERMHLAAELLKTDELAISRVAYECGYDNYSYFTKVFKKKYGETPREYRSRYIR